MDEAVRRADRLMVDVQIVSSIPASRDTARRGPQCRPGKLRATHLEHDPEKWKPVFRKDHAQIKEIRS
jgi:hypothetical protein